MTMTATIDRAAVKELAVQLAVASMKLDRAGAPNTSPVHQKQAAAMDTAIQAGIPLNEISHEADHRFAAYMYASQEPGFTAILDYDGTLTEQALAMPDWWDKAVDETVVGRRFAAKLLAEAAPSYRDGIITLLFPDEDAADLWILSGSGAALTAALTELGIDAQVVTGIANP